MKRYIICLTGMIFYVCFMLQTVSHVHGEDGGVDFGVEALTTNLANQLQPGQSYFDLKMKPNQHENIQVKLFNRSNHVVKIQSEIHTAFTNEQGKLEYTIKQHQLDRSLKYPLTKQIMINENDQVVRLQPGQIKTVNATISMPNATFEGVLAGGWYFKHANASKTGGISNDYAYLVGVKLTQNSEVEPDIQIRNMRLVKGNQNNQLKITFANDQPVIMSQTKATVEVTKHGNNKFQKKSQMTGISFAPNASFTLPLNWGSNQVTAGKYQVELTVESQDPKFKKKKIWHFRRMLTISAQQASKFSQKRDWSLVGWSILGLFLIGILAIMVQGHWRSEHD